MTDPLGRVAEGRHRATDDPAWVETWTLDLIDNNPATGEIVAATFQVVIAPGHNAAAFHASFVATGRELVTLSEIEAAIPTAPGLELRAPGLWAELGIQVPMLHATLDIEAFAVQLSDPEEVFGRAYGDRVAFGCELEWETEAPIETEASGSYELACDVHGELLIGDEVIEVDGWGWRSHRWGSDVFARHRLLRGRRGDGRWWSESDALPAGLETVARAPLAQPIVGHNGRLEQQVVRADSAAGTADLAWARSFAS